MKWYFPYGQNLQKESANNSRIETFRDNIVGSLAREVSQNSVDEVSDDNHPVHIKFELKYIDNNKIADLESFKKYVIPNARETWKGDSDAEEFLDKFVEVTSNPKIPVLKISDYNTTGLVGKKWDALVLNTGTSYKSQEDSQGSFGIGKAAPFAASDLRMVFYESMLDNNDFKSMGVNQFISFDFSREKEIYTAQGIGFLGENRNKFKDNSFDLGFSKREVPGTDIFVIAFNQTNNWEEEIVLSLLKNFMFSIYLSKLSFDVNGLLINKKSLLSIIKKYDEIKELETTRNYLSVLTDKNKVVIPLDNRFKEYNLEPEDAFLYINKTKEANRSVMMTRKSGMKIFDQKYISGSIQFNGIFHATGLNLNKILKTMENPNHNDWIPSRYVRDPKKAENILKDLRDFFRENVRSNYEETPDSIVDAYGVSDFLPVLDVKVSSNTEDNEESFSLENIKLDERRKPALSNRDTAGVEEFIDRDIFEIVDGNIGIKGDNLGPKKTLKENNILVSDRDGVLNSGELSNQGIITRGKVKGKEIEGLSIRVIEMDILKGKYRTVLNTNKSYENLRLEFSLVTELNSSYQLNATNAYINGVNVCEDGYVFVERVQDNTQVTIDVVLQTNIRNKIEVRVYEN